MSLSEIRDAVHAWTREDLPWGEAILVGVRRSAPRPPGARYAVGEDGTFAGTISAGCVEADLREHLLALLESPAAAGPAIVSYGISDEMAATVGLSCGGEIDVLLVRHEPGDAAWASLVDLLAGDGRAALVTGMGNDILGRQVVVRPDGSVMGTLGHPELDATVADEGDRLFAREGSEALAIDACPPLFVDRILPARRLVIVGATPIGAALCELAVRLDYRVTVADPREGLIASSGFAGADVRVAWPAEALADPGIDEWTDVVILTHDDRLDLPALSAALSAGCRFVGLLGGKRTQRLRREALLAEGFTRSAVERIRGPVGLAIGAVTPREIAVAILAEMLAVRRLGPGAAR